MDLEKRRRLAEVLRDHISDTQCGFVDHLILQDNLESASDEEVSSLIEEARQHILANSCVGETMKNRLNEVQPGTFPERKPTRHNQRPLAWRGRYVRPA